MRTIIASTKEAAAITTIERHALDPNYPVEPIAKFDAETVLETVSIGSSGRDRDSTTKEGIEAIEILSEDAKNSPYEEVRAAVSPEDDPNMRCNTFRVWFIGVILVILFAGVNQFFTLRYPSVTMTAIVGQLISFPMGKFLARFLPRRVFHIGKFSFTLNHGDFNIKEHSAIVVMLSVAYSNNYAANILQVLYHPHLV